MDTVCDVLKSALATNPGEILPIVLFVTKFTLQTEVWVTGTAMTVVPAGIGTLGFAALPKVNLNDRQF